VRHEASRRSRQALEPKRLEQVDDETDEDNKKENKPKDSKSDRRIAGSERKPE
jgi:hypothetical protein